jgi:hypothetical protein
MAWSDFYITPTGNNLNSGFTSADAADYTTTSGNWDGTSIFTPTDSSTPSTYVSVNDWVSVYLNAATSTAFIAQVTAVGAGVNGTITVSTTVRIGTVPGSSTGGMSLKHGGAWGRTGSTVDLGIVTSLFTTGTVQTSTRVNVKASTYASAATVRSFATAGSTTAPLWWRGYKTSIGDQDTNASPVDGTDIPYWTFSGSGRATIAAGYQIFSSISVTSAANTIDCTGINTLIRRCKLVSTAGSPYYQHSTATNGRLYLCYLQSDASHAVLNVTANVLYLVGCSLRGGNAGLTTGASLSGMNFYYCIFDSIGGDAINIGSASDVHMVGCGIYNPTGNGVNISAAPGICDIINCHFENCNQSSKGAINNTSGTNTILVRLAGNSYYNGYGTGLSSPVTGITESFTNFDAGTVASSGFDAPASHSFNPTSSIEGVGVPGAFQGETYTGHMTTSAVMPAAGGGGSLSRVFSSF